METSMGSVRRQRDGLRQSGNIRREPVQRVGLRLEQRLELRLELRQEQRQELKLELELEQRLE